MVYSIKYISIKQWLMGLMNFPIANNPLQPKNTIHVYAYNNSNNSIVINDFNIQFQK